MYNTSHVLTVGKKDFKVVRIMLKQKG